MFSIKTFLVGVDKRMKATGNSFIPLYSIHPDKTAEITNFPESAFPECGFELSANHEADV